MSVVSELRRRNVFRVVFAYLVVGWLLTEVLTTILPELGAPAWASRTVILVFALGFIPAVILPWIYELTPEGIKRESEIAGASDARGSTRTFDYLAIATVAALILVLAVLGARTTVDTPQLSGPAISSASVAVLPFVNMTGDKDYEYFSDGLTETLLHMLVQIPDLQVAARTSSFAFKNQTKTAREIATALQVAHILEGSVQLAGKRVRITAQLIRADDGFHVWSSNFDRDFDDIFAIQDEIAKEVGSALSASLLGTAQGADVAGVSTSSPDAYDLYLQALAERATFSYGGLQAAEDLLKGALATDPDFLDAKTELAYNYLHQAETGLMSEDEAETQCTAMTNQVLAVRPDDPGASAIQLFVESGGEHGVGDPDRVFDVITQLEALVAANPANYPIQILLARLLIMTQQFDRALILHLEASQKDPLNPRIHYELGSLYLQLNRVADARAALEKSLEIEPRQPNAYVKLGQLALQQGDGTDAVRYFLRAFEVDPRDHELPGFLALFLYDLELIEEGDDFRDLVLAIAPTSEIAYEIELRRAIMTGDTVASDASARRAIEDDVGERYQVFSDSVRHLMRAAASDGTIEEITAYLERHAPGLFDISAAAAPQKYREAQAASFDAWYATLPRDEVLRRLDDALRAAGEFGIDPLEEPETKMAVHAIRGKQEAAIRTALDDVFSLPVTSNLRWRETFSQSFYTDMVVDERVRSALQRWEEEYEALRQSVRAYLADLSAAAFYLPLTGLFHFDLNQFFAVRIGYVDGAGDTRVEAVNRAQDLERLLGIDHLVPVLQCGLVSTGLTIRIARTGVPGAGYDRLVVCDLLVLDHDPVRQCATRRLHDPDALAGLRPGLRLPQGLVEGPRLASLDIGDERIEPALHGVGKDRRFERTRRGATQRREQRLDRCVERSERRVDQLLRRLVTFRIQHQYTSQWPDFHRLAVPARRFEP
jgi:TolB-like protein/Flp pilus assembly protein TadD